MLETTLMVVWGLAGVALFVAAVFYLVRRHKELDYYLGEIKTDTEETSSKEEDFSARKMSINPEDPPRVMVFNPAPGLDEGYQCDCCNRALGKGQEVIWWPNPETGGVELYCPDKVDVNE